MILQLPCFGLLLSPSSLGQNLFFAELEKLFFLLLHNFSGFHSCATSTWQGALWWRQNHSWGPSARNTETSLFGLAENTFLQQVATHKRTCSIPKPTFFRALDKLMVEFIPLHLAWLIGICQVGLGPEGVPDWVIFSEKWAYKDEGFNVLSAPCPWTPRPMGSTCPPVGVGQSKTRVRGRTSLLAVKLQRRVPTCKLWALALRMILPAC